VGHRPALIFLDTPNEAGLDTSHARPLFYAATAK